MVFKVSQVINGLRLLWAEERKRKKKNHLCYFLCVKDWRLISAPPLQIGLRTGSIPPLCVCVCVPKTEVLQCHYGRALPGGMSLLQHASSGNGHAVWLISMDGVFSVNMPD